MPKPSPHLRVNSLTNELYDCIPFLYSKKMTLRLRIELTPPIEKDWDYTMTAKGTEYQPPTVTYEPEPHNHSCNPKGRVCIDLEENLT